ncbi:MAG: hypothetical protein UX88_C0011G0012 [Candidatus Woesebacteria bacterium GW2011_GWC2_47_16]|uniref:Uncharacterized protein n=4 Tax=Candidatus Woeseibacteriota TaxID=1752722 RepID=A0A0G1V3U5_9BACT|nr:MAG: hypothetical protein UX03_C0006G0016 [Candidatus Woesebacteria bacterium GW2011_GWE1_45_18]KKU64595.1 MAG: hypothetical protein UX88_C0011G0012 [Candidatus Woesebacteria bacterium GW2011_GWC2_47_16]
MQEIMLPTHPWSQIKPYIKSMGEGELLTHFDLGDDYDFLTGIGIIDAINTGELTVIGKSLFEASFIRHDDVEEQRIIQDLLLAFPPTQAVQQYLWGVKDITIDQVLTVLKVTNFWIFEEKRLLTHFLDLLNLGKIIKYDRKNRKITILISTDQTKTPRSVYIEPTRPYGNIYWAKRILSECEGFIYWFDKHFMKDAFDWIYTVADANKISDIRILSLDLGEHNLNKQAKKDYKRLKDELAKKKISLEWRTIHNDKVKDAHDRWIIGDKEYVRNLPDVNTILSGKRSEMMSSDNYDKVISAFRDYWDAGVEVPH